MDTVIPDGIRLDGLFGDEKEESAADLNTPPSPPAAPTTHCLKFHFNHGKYSNYWISEAMTEEEASTLLYKIGGGSHQRLYKVNDALINIPQVTYIEIIEAS